MRVDELFDATADYLLREGWIQLSPTHGSARCTLAAMWTVVGKDWEGLDWGLFAPVEDTEFSIESSADVTLRDGILELSRMLERDFELDSVGVAQRIVDWNDDYALDRDFVVRTLRNYAASLRETVDGE